MFLVCAGVLIASIGLNADWGLADLLPEDYDLSSIAGDAVLLVFVITLLVKYLVWRHRRRSGIERDDGLTWLGQSRRPAPRNPRK